MLIKKLMIDQSVKKGLRKASMFRPQAEYIFRRMVKVDPSIAAETIENQRAAREFMSIMMSVGSELTKGKYIFTGAVIGTLGTLTVLNIKKNREKA